MNDQKNVIHIRIRDLRREHSLTQEELAEALGISRQSINAMEAGRCLPSLPVALEIASFFAVPIHFLFGENEGIGFALQPTTRPHAALQDALNNMFDEPRKLPATASSVAAVNISQTVDEIHVDLRLPGYKKEDISLEFGQDFLTVKAEQRLESNESEKEYVYREFAAQSVHRTIPLPALVQPENAVAEMKQGVLHIRLYKLVEEKPKARRITITSEE